jgi:hypothetical protein
LIFCPGFAAAALNVTWPCKIRSHCSGNIFVLHLCFRCLR